MYHTADAYSEKSSIRSRHSSIRGPYRKGMDDPETFAYCQLIKNADTSPDHFARSLLSAGQGFPLWAPKGNFNRPSEHLKNGFSIGDVVRPSSDGHFVFYFNIFYPASHPIQSQDVPPSFEPCPISLDELEIRKEKLPSGTVIASHGVDVTRVSDSPLEIHMTSAAREGAVLVFPEGASREDIAEPQKLYPYVRDNIADWYRHIRLEAMYPDAIVNGAMYLITGCDRPLQGASEWAIFPFHKRTTGATDIRYLPQAPEGVYLDASRDVRSDRLGLEMIPEIDTASNIVRGMKLALPPTLWPQIISQHPTERMYYQILSTPVLGWYARLLQRRDRHFGVPMNPRVEGALVSFHPSEIICQLLLEKSPSARVAIVEDRLWMSAVVDEPCTLPNIRNLLLRVFAMHEIVTKDGIAHLVRRSTDAEKNVMINKALTLLPFVESFPGENFVKRRLKAILKTRID